MFRITCLLLVFTSILLGCGNIKTETSEIEVVAKADGPFYAGSNSLISNVNLNLDEILAGIDFKEVVKVTIDGISIQLEGSDEVGFEMFSSAVIQLVSDKSPMTIVAIHNPITTTDNKLKLTVSDDAEVTTFFQEGKFSLLLDLDFKEDSYSQQLDAKVKVNLKIEYK